MAIANVVTRGYGPSASIAFVVTRGYSVGVDITAAISGTTAFTEEQVKAGGETIVITLSNDTWVASGTIFNLQRQNIINGISSAQSEVTGWNNEVRDTISVSAVVRTSNNVVTLTLPATSYQVTQDEVITVIVPSEALVGSSSAITATPTIGVTADAALLFAHILQFRSASNEIIFTGEPPRVTKFESKSNELKIVGTVAPLAFILLETGGSLLLENGLEILRD